jgi:hypothetical protein
LYKRYFFYTIGQDGRQAQLNSEQQFLLDRVKKAKIASGTIRTGILYDPDTTSIE